MFNIEIGKTDVEKVYVGLSVLLAVAVSWAIYKLTSSFFMFDPDSLVFSHFIITLIAAIPLMLIIGLGRYVLFIFWAVQRKFNPIIKTFIPLILAVITLYFASKNNWKLDIFTEDLTQNKFLYLWDSFAVINILFFLGFSFDILDKDDDSDNHLQERIAYIIIILSVIFTSLVSFAAIFLFILLLAKEGPYIFFIQGILLFIYPAVFLPYSIFKQRIYDLKYSNNNDVNFISKTYSKFGFIVSFSLSWMFSVLLTMGLFGADMGSGSSRSGSIVIKINGVVQSGSSWISDSSASFFGVIVLLVAAYISWMKTSREFVQIFLPLKTENNMSDNASGKQTFFDKLHLISDDDVEYNSRKRLVFFKIFMGLSVFLLFSIGLGLAGI